MSDFSAVSFPGHLITQQQLQSTSLSAPCMLCLNPSKLSTYAFSPCKVLSHTSPVSLITYSILTTSKLLIPLWPPCLILSGLHTSLCSQHEPKLRSFPRSAHDPASTSDMKSRTINIVIVVWNFLPTSAWIRGKTTSKAHNQVHLQ